MKNITEILDSILKKNNVSYSDLNEEQKRQYNKYHDYFSKTFTIEDVRKGLEKHKIELLKDMSDFTIVGDRAIFIKACYNINEFILSLISKDEAQRKVVREELERSAESGDLTS